MFHPDSNRDAWLARDADFMTAALSVIRARPRGVRSLLRTVLRLWPKELDTATQIQFVLKSELRDTKSPRLLEWGRRVEKYRLLSADGPRKLADQLALEPGRAAEVLDDAGLVGELSQSAFLAEVHRQLADRLKRLLAEKRYQDLDSTLDLLAPGGHLAFQTQAPFVADALLLPFLQSAPPADVQTTIQAFLLTHLKDPRLTQSGWARVDPAAKDVMLRWMVSASLEDFFALIARRAQEDHWRYRKAFWSAYLRRGHIAHAWVILGDNVELEAQRRWRDAVPAHARLSGASPDHCVLLLQIGSLTIAEWSHNGTCRMWLQNDKKCPSFYRAQYSGVVLRADAKYEQRHVRNTQYTWQQKLSEAIRRETDIAVTLGDYRVRGR
jgi:hypothetical protein